MIADDAILATQRKKRDRGYLARLPALDCFADDTAIWTGRSLAASSARI